MAEDQRKVRLIAQFLEESFVECSVLYDHEDKYPVARSYQIVDEATGKLRHYAFVSRGFLADHAEAEIVPTLQSLAFLECLKIAGTRCVTVKSEVIEFEAGG